MLHLRQSRQLDLQVGEEDLLRSAEKFFTMNGTTLRSVFLTATLVGGCTAQISLTGAETGGATVSDGVGTAGGTGPGAGSTTGAGAGIAASDATGGQSSSVGGSGAVGMATGTGAATATGGAGTPTGGAGTPTGGTPTVLSRLTAAQYNSTLKDLFAPLTIPDQLMPADVAVEGFDNNASAQTPSAALIEAYRTSAVAITAVAMKTPASFLGCTPKTAADETACATSFLGTFGKKAFRHPVTSTELANMVAFYASTRPGAADFATAMSLTVQAILQSPSFLYRVEIGSPVVGQPGAIQLTAYEMASRLSYLLWNTMPDDALFASAAAGELDTPAGLDAQARRMLGSARAHAAVLNFHSQWLRFEKMNNLVKSAAMFPQFGPAVATAMRQSAEKFVDSIFFGAGTLTALLTDNHAWVNDVLAPVYGVTAPAGSTMSLVALDPTQRSGILTNAGLLAGFAHETADSPVMRGVFVLQRLMCSAPPPPPASVNTTPPAADSGTPQTTRQRFATQHEQGTCAGCHRIIDGIGFGFEHYDALGQWRTSDAGLTVDSSGSFVGSTDLTGTFDGAVDLGTKLAGSASVRACVASQWMRYALGVDGTGVDTTTLGPIVTAFEQSGLNMRELVVALVKSSAFRTRAIGI
jgi:Protein of unknown function (DUF1592)/Protein of unknown function (DUF1588)/Protein of unknown function (DUF1595)/Protein of unknown function (DUF1585)/Protein of unknown function (DUF1587)